MCVDVAEYWTQLFKASNVRVDGCAGRWWSGVKSGMPYCGIKGLVDG